MARFKGAVIPSAVLALLALLVLPACTAAKPPAAPGGSPSSAAPGATARTPAAPRQVVAIEGITEYALENGMRVLLFPDRSQDKVTVNVTYLVGSRHEGYGETGMAHLLEHMLFKGSPKHPKVWEELNQRGADNNASTWYDRTNYYETLAATGDNLAWALEMEADRMVNANIAAADLKSEFSVVRNEFELGENDPALVLSERTWSTAYLWHNYGKSTIGSRADIERVPAERLRAFYEKYYRPDNAILVVAGRFEPAAALELVNKSFGVIARPSHPLPATYTVEPVQDGERVVTLRRAGDVQMVGLLYHGPAGADEQFAATEAIADILTAEPSGRLYKALVRSGMAAEVNADTLSLHDPGVLEITAKIRTGKSAERARDRMIAVVEGLATGKITEEEVARFRAKFRRAFKLAFANSQTIATELSEAIATGDWRLVFLHRDQVDKLTVDLVQKAAARYLVSSNRTVGLFLPTAEPVRAPMEQAPDVAALVKDYKGGKGISEGEVFEASVANIEKRTTRSALKSGLKVAFLPKETRGDVVRAQLTVRFATEKDLTGRRVASDMLADMMRRGTRKHSFQQLKDEWDRLEAQVGFSSGPGQLEVHITTVRDTLPAVLALVDEVLKQPSFPADQFGVAIKERLAQLEEQRSRPEGQAFVAFQRVMTPHPADHPSYVATIDEEIAATRALGLAQVRRLHAWLGMSDATLTVVGDFDPAAVQPWLDGGWGAWKSPRPYQRIATRYVQTKAGVQFIDTPDKENALIVLGYAVPMRDDNPDYPPMTAANYVLGGGGFVSRLLTRLRQKDGLSYGAFSFYQADPLDELAVLGAGAILAPQNAAKGMTAALEEFDKLASQGVPAQELDSAKQGIAKDWSRALADDEFVMDRLHEGLFLGRTMDFYGKRQQAIQALQPAQLNAVIKKYFKRGEIYQVTGGDKKKAGGA